MYLRLNTCSYQSWRLTWTSDSRVWVQRFSQELGEGLEVSIIQFHGCYWEGEDHGRVTACRIQYKMQCAFYWATKTCHNCYTKRGNVREIKGVCGYLRVCPQWPRHSLNALGAFWQQRYSSHFCTITYKIINIVKYYCKTYFLYRIDTGWWQLAGSHNVPGNITLIWNLIWFDVAHLIRHSKALQLRFKLQLAAKLNVDSRPLVQNPPHLLTVRARLPAILGVQLDWQLWVVYTCEKLWM